MATLGGIDAAGQPRLLSRIALLYGQMGAHREALVCHRQLAAMLPDNPDVLQGLAASEMAVGDIAAADEHFSRAIAVDPGQADAWYNLSTLRRQTSSHNHIDALRTRLAGPDGTTARAVPLNFALAKELEDLGDYRDAFQHLKAGADRRRAVLSYRVETDVDAMAAIASAFPRQMPTTPAANADFHPIFVLGLPRTGTTLVERILSAHPEVESLGELTEFAMALTRAIPEPAAKLDMIRRAGALDAEALGRAYLAAVDGYRTGPRCFIDKLPSNFLYIGLIRRGLPDARIVHLRRHPLDSLYAIYKTLFRMGYPYSYSLDDLARYYSAYYRLMAHWRDAFPDGVIDVDYESLVGDPEGVTATLLESCGLSWHAGCLEFHRLKTPVATASASQVREPVYRRSVGLWRHYADELEPLIAALRAQGIDPEGVSP